MDSFTAQPLSINDLLANDPGELTAIRESLATMPSDEPASVECFTGEADRCLIVQDPLTFAGCSRGGDIAAFQAGELDLADFGMTVAEVLAVIDTALSETAE